MIHHDTTGHENNECKYVNGHGVAIGYVSGTAADNYVSTHPAPNGRRYEVRDNNLNPDKATALEVWCLPAYAKPKSYYTDRGYSYPETGPQREDYGSYGEYLEARSSEWKDNTDWSDPKEAEKVLNRDLERNLFWREQGSILANLAPNNFGV